MSDYDEERRVRGFLITPLRFCMLALLLGSGYVVVWLHAYDLGVIAGQEELPPVVYAEGEAEKLVPADEGGKKIPFAEDGLDIYKVLRSDDDAQTAAVTPPPSAQPATPSQPQRLPQQTSEGRYSVQLASLRSETDAMRRRDEIKTDNVSLLGEYAVDIEQANLGERGIYYRLLLNGFATRDGAKGLCDRLLEAGQDCLVKWR